MNFTPVLSQAIPDPDWGWLLFRGFARDALGLKDRQEQTLRKQLKPQYDWVKLRGSDKVERVFYTPQGLSELCCKVGSDRAMAFLKAVGNYCPSNGSAIVRTESAHVTTWQQPAQAVTPYHAVETHYPEALQPDYRQSAQPEPAGPLYQAASQQPQTLQQINHHYYMTVQPLPPVTKAEPPAPTPQSQPQTHYHTHQWTDPGGFFNWLGVSVALTLATIAAFSSISLYINALQPHRGVNIQLQTPQPGGFQ